MKNLHKSLYNTRYNKILCVGKNYALHAKEMKSEIPEKPLFFDKPHSSIIRTNFPLQLSSDNECHHEIELGVLIGMTGKNIK